MRLGWKITIIVTIVLVGAPVFVWYVFIPVSNYIEEIQYRSSLPEIQVEGRILDEGNERHRDLKYSIHPSSSRGIFAPAIGSTYYLLEEDIAPELVGEFVRITGYLEDNYERRLLWLLGVSISEEYKIVRVIYVKEIEILDSPFVI